jgi:hypothetical protein
MKVLSLELYFYTIVDEGNSNANLT